MTITGPQHHQDDRRPSERGFTLIEALVALFVFAIVAAMVFVFMNDAHKNIETESTAIETQQAARVSLDELGYSIQQTGYGITRADTSNAATWQRDVVYAGSHAVAFNADVDSTKGPLNAGTTLTFPDGSTYKGEGTAGVTAGAETYVYTLDANADGSITTADRTAAAVGSSNPAAATDNPLDYAVFRRVYGYDGSSYGGALIPVTAYLFTNATSTDAYPDTTTPDPLFTYWLTEDLDGDGVLANSECVVTPCPPTATRAPQLYIWGDTDFSGTLSEAEKTVLRTLPVGSASWSNNRLATAGAFYSTTLSALADTSTGTRLNVASAANFGVGEHVVLGTGTSAEKFVVASTDTTVTPNRITISVAPKNSHASGESVAILPQTLLRAIRTVQITFDAITPKKDFDNALSAAAVGRSGRLGTKGLDYRVRPFERKVELINLQTGALSSTNFVTTPTCPATFTASCSGGAITTIDVFTPRSTTVPISFVLNDADGVGIPGKTVTFTNSNTSVGTLAPASGTSDSSGIVTTNYTPTGTAGTDTVTASNACINGSLTAITMTAALTVNTYALEATRTGNDCMRTFRSGYAAPSSAFTVKVKGPGGSYLNNYPVSLTLAFDPAYLPVAPVYTLVQGQLSVTGSPVGVTSSTTGSFGPYSATTGAGGTLSGAIAMTSDVLGNGARLFATVSIPDSSCATYGTSTALGLLLYKLALSSVTPTALCTENAPCSIASNTFPLPSVKANLSVNSTPITGAAISFTSDDYVKPVPAAASVLTPSSGWSTDASGDATVQVANNNNAAITAGSPLKTHIDATTTGPGTCSNGSISSLTLRPQFDFQGPSATGCDVDLQQAWIKKGSANDKLCIDVQNKIPVGGCDVTITGMQFAVYKTDNVTLEGWKLQKLFGGDNVASTGSCSATNQKQFFVKNCNGGNDLPNNTRWDFVNAPTNCYLAPNPPNPLGPQEYFVFNSVDFSSNVAGLSPKRRFVITVYFQCAGTCSSAVQSKTFDLLTP